MPPQDQILQTCLLFTLAAELRNQIYSLILEISSSHLQTFSILIPQPPTQPGKALISGHKKAVPAITQVSRQLRWETRAIFFQITDFSFIFLRTGFGPMPASNVTNFVATWAKEVAQGDLDDVRCITVVVNLEWMTVRFDEEGGLRIDPPNWTGKSTWRRGKLARRARKVNEERHIEDKGRALMEAIVGDSRVWDDGCLLDDYEAVMSTRQL